MYILLQILAVLLHLPVQPRHCDMGLHSNASELLELGMQQIQCGQHPVLTSWPACIRVRDHPAHPLERY